MSRPDVMRAFSVTVKMTPRQAVAAARACELAGVTTSDRRAWMARHRIFAGLRDAGWEWDENGEAWTRGRAAVGDPS
jgi:hypothetical protein